MNREKLINLIVKSVMKALEEEKPLSLQEAWNRDQSERAEYDTYLREHKGDWRSAANSYRQSKGIPEGQDVFTDYTQHAKAHLDTTPPENLSHEDWTALWGLAQHADKDTEFQTRTRDLIKQHKGTDWRINDNTRHSAYQYLDDRINVNTGRPQRYGTQNTST
jgi:hypothetical protein